MATDPPRTAAEEDAGAEEIMALARDGVTADLLGCLVLRDVRALARHQSRLLTRALRTGLPELLHDALLAAAIADAVWDRDPRDSMVSLARHHYVAQQLGLDPAEAFSAAVSGLPDQDVADLFRTIGARDDITLESFGWKAVQTEAGPDFELLDPVDLARLRSLVQEAKQRRRRYLEGRFGTEGADKVQRSNAKLFGTET